MEQNHNPYSPSKCYRPTSTATISTTCPLFRLLVFINFRNDSSIIFPTCGVNSSLLFLHKFQKALPGPTTQGFDPQVCVPINVGLLPPFSYESSNTIPIILLGVTSGPFCATQHLFPTNNGYSIPRTEQP